MKIVWVLVVAYTFSTSVSTEKFGPYPDLEACKLAATSIEGLDPWVRTTPLSCTPEPAPEK